MDGSSKGGLGTNAPSLFTVRWLMDTSDEGGRNCGVGGGFFRDDDHFFQPRSVPSPFARAMAINCFVSDHHCQPQPRALFKKTRERPGSKLLLISPRPALALPFLLSLTRTRKYNYIVRVKMEEEKCGAGPHFIHLTLPPYGSHLPKSAFSN